MPNNIVERATHYTLRWDNVQALLPILQKTVWVRPSEAVQRLLPGSAGVPPNAASYLHGESFGDVRLFAAAFNKEVKNRDFERF